MASACECDNDPVANFTQDIPMCMNFRQIFIFLSNTTTLFYSESFVQKISSFLSKIMWLCLTET
jgi:hypothetical protein